MGIETAFQTALYQRLAASTLGVTGIYDVAPQAADGGDGTAFPYVVIGKAVMSPLDTKSTIGHAILQRLHVFSRSGEMLECKRVQDAIFDALHLKVMSVDGHGNFVLRRQMADAWPDEDMKIHGVSEYRALIERA